MKKDSKSVMGVYAPPPRITLKGCAILGLIFGGPVLVVLFGIDLVLWLRG